MEEDLSLMRLFLRTMKSICIWVKNKFLIKETRLKKKRIQISNPIKEEHELIQE